MVVDRDDKEEGYYNVIKSVVAVFLRTEKERDTNKTRSTLVFCFLSLCFRVFLFIYVCKT